MTGAMTGAMTSWVRSALRHQRRAVIGLAVLTMVASAVPLVAGAGARRTASSVERMREELAPYDLNVQFEEEPRPEDTLARIIRLPGVETAAEGASILARPLGSGLGEFESFGQGGFDPSLGRSFERPRVDAGRLPETADEVLLSPRVASEMGLGVGDDLVLETFTPAAIDRIFAGEPASYDGPKVSLRIVGVGRQPEELTGGADYPAPLFVVAPPFFEAWAGAVHWFDGVFLVRLVHGLDGLDDFSAALRAEFPDRPDLAIHASEESARIADAVSAQTVALVILALVALVTGALAVAQASVRVSRGFGRDHEVLAALGLDRRWRALARTAVVGLPVAAGVAGATLLAIAASGLLPTGPARRVEPDPGIQVDAAILGGGAVVLIAAALVATVMLGRPRGIVRRSRRPVPVVEALARTAPSVATAVGVRSALRPDRGPTAIPSRSAMVAIGAGAAGLVASLVFASSLDRLVREPARYGWNWDYLVALGDELSDADALSQARSVLDDPRISGALYARIASREIAGESTVVMGVQPLAGDLHTTIVEGRHVLADDEIVLGQTTLELIGARVGGSVEIGARDGTEQLRVVGKGLFPSEENEDPAAGAAVTLAAMERLEGSGGFPNLYVTAEAGVDHQALTSDLEESFGFVVGAVRPPIVTNLELIDQSPYLVAGYLGLLGAAVSAHAVLMTIRQRRGELATLKTLCFVRRQVAATVISQTMTIAIVGVVVGMPLGLAAGRLAWRSVAGGLGFAGDPRNPLGPLMAVAPGAVTVAVLIAVLPAWWIARTRPAAILRAE